MKFSKSKSAMKCTPDWIFHWFALLITVLHRKSNNFTLWIHVWLTIVSPAMCTRKVDLAKSAKHKILTFPVVYETRPFLWIIFKIALLSSSRRNTTFFLRRFADLTSSSPSLRDRLPLWLCSRDSAILTEVQNNFILANQILAYSDCGTEAAPSCFHLY